MWDSSIVWDFRFLRLAREVSSWSKDPSTQVGAVIIDDNNRVVSIGYNGFPRSIEDDERLNNREEKYKIIVHAEMNALLFANRSLEKCTLYTYPFMPCPRCASMLIQSGISRVVSPENSHTGWEEDFKTSRQMFAEAGVFLHEYSEFE